MPDVVWIAGATCRRCGHELSVEEFQSGHQPGRATWPLLCSLALIGQTLFHAGCEGTVRTVTLESVTS